MTETRCDPCVVRFSCDGRVGVVYTCFFANALIFVILLCTNITAGVIYLFCLVSVVAVCICFACTRYLCEMRLATNTKVSCSEV
jgi:hypothetical protein